MIKITVIVTAVMVSAIYLGPKIFSGESESAFEKSPPVTEEQVESDTRYIINCLKEYGSLNISVVDAISTRGVPNRRMLFSENNRCGSYKFKKSDEKTVTQTVAAMVEKI
jgi:hypothetical protein